MGKRKYTSIRLEPDLKKKVKEQAKRNRRSMRAEIELLIEQGVTASAAK